MHDGGFDGAAGVGAAATFAGAVVDGFTGLAAVVDGGLAPVVVLRGGRVAPGARVLGTAVGDDGSGGTGCASASDADSVMGPLADFRNTAHVVVMAPPQITRMVSVTTIRFVVTSLVTGPSTATRHRIDGVDRRAGPSASGTERHSCCASDSKALPGATGAAITRSTVCEPNAPAQKVTVRDHHAPNGRPTFRQRGVTTTSNRPPEGGPAVEVCAPQNPAGTSQETHTKFKGILNTHPPQ